jgi:hypothetical protein
LGKILAERVSITDVSKRDSMSNGVHYSSTTALYEVWIDGSAVAHSCDRAIATAIYVALLRRDQVNGFRATEQWMVAAYGE